MKVTAIGHAPLMQILALLILLLSISLPVRAAEMPLYLDRAARQGGVVIGQVTAQVAELRFNGETITFDAQGNFLLGFGRDAAPAALLQLLLKSGLQEDVHLPVGQRHYDVEVVNGLPPRTVELSPADQRRRLREVAAITAARAGESDLDDWREPFMWPARGPIGGVYGSARIRNGVEGSPHNGIDVKARSGTPVLAPAGGVVRLAVRDFLLEGGLIILDHGRGLYSDFLHLSRIDVQPGDVVRQGQILGAVGATGRATGPHLHWGMKWREARIDPQLLAPPLP